MSGKYYFTNKHKNKSEQVKKKCTFLDIHACVYLCAGRHVDLLQSRKWSVNVLQSWRTLNLRKVVPTISLSVVLPFIIYTQKAE